MAKQATNQQQVQDSPGRKMLAEMREKEAAAKTVTVSKPELKGPIKGSMRNTADSLRALLIEAVEFARQIEPTEASISDRLLGIAKRFQTPNMVVKEPNGDKESYRSENFIAACKMEEDWLKSKEAGEHQRETLPRCWTQAKSNIKAAIEFGIDLSKFDTESALRKRKSEVAGYKGSSNLSKDVKAALSSAKDSLDGLTEKEQLKLIRQFQSAINAARLALKDVMPEEPEQQEEDTSETEEEDTPLAASA